MSANIYSQLLQFCTSGVSRFLGSIVLVEPCRRFNIRHEESKERYRATPISPRNHMIRPLLPSCALRHSIIYLSDSPSEIQHTMAPPSAKIVLSLCLLSGASAQSAQSAKGDAILTDLYARRFAAFIAADDEYQNPAGSIELLLAYRQPVLYPIISLLQLTLVPHASSLSHPQRATRQASGTTCGRSPRM